MKSIPMKRSRQALSQQEIIEILRRNTYGTLALNDPSGYPYQIPMNYVFANGKLVFHCSLSGHKTDLIQKDPKASFCVVDFHETKTELISSIYRSVVVTGKISLIESDQDKKEALNDLAHACFDDIIQQVLNEEIDRMLRVVTVFELEPVDMSGKQAKELIGTPISSIPGKD